MEITSQLDQIHLEPEFKEYFPNFYSKLGTFDEIVQIADSKKDPECMKELFQEVKRQIYDTCSEELHATLRDQLTECMKHPV